MIRSKNLKLVLFVIAILTGLFGLLIIDLTIKYFRYPKTQAISTEICLGFRSSSGAVEKKIIAFTYKCPGSIGGIRELTEKSIWLDRDERIVDVISPMTCANVYIEPGDKVTTLTFDKDVLCEFFDTPNPLADRISKIVYTVDNTNGKFTEISRN